MKSKRITEITVEVEETFTIRRNPDSSPTSGIAGSRAAFPPVANELPALLPGTSTSPINPSQFTAPKEKQS